MPPKDLAIEYVINKTVNHYSIPLEISEGIRRVFKAKLWRMGSALSKMGGFKSMKKIESWKDEEWKHKVDISEAKQNEKKLKLRRLKERGKGLSKK